ncbi:hypothetical protein [Candidatus Leptofilum sp.]|uniref:hypothetical protein n=1 Tax=Candidatus Leptofilum sp. TaxID=3241576 RepID=UPI003B59E36B
MKPRHLIYLLVLLTFLAACNGDGRPTPTPFAEEDVTEEALNPAAPLEISITDLAADPEAFANSFVELTGQYQRLPLLVCDSDPHPSPAKWQLTAEDGSLIAVGGFDSQLRSLLPNDLTMTVAGVWQLFEGPVGCGKDAVSMQIWYLKVSDIISPSPIARVTLTPTGEGSQVADNGDDNDTPPDDNQDGTQATPTLANNDDPGSPPDSTPTSASTTVPSLPGSNTPTSSPTSSGGSGAGTTPTGTPTSQANGTNTPTPANGDSTPTATSSGGTATPTSSGGGGGNPTPTSIVLSTATRNPNDFDVVEFDDLSPEEPVLEILDSEQTHLWPILFENTGAITVTAIAETTVNLVLEIVDPADDVVQQADNGGNGALESIVNAQLNVALDYRIRVYDLNGSGGEYCLIFSEAGGFPDTIKGRLAYNQTVNQTIEVLGINYWCFMGNDGDNISITASATGNDGDFVVGLFGPPDFEAIGNVFTGGTLTNIVLEEDGMYIIGVLDFEAGEADYSLTLTQN